jgi:sulfate adenylyltransferase subunit 1 (EFTu-like GTPase family)
MEKRVWTARGVVAAGDEVVIKRIAGHNPVASRIFLTGEVHESHIGETASILLNSINDVIDGAMKGHDGKFIEEPLFIQTK